jgi:outer membrane protein
MDRARATLVIAAASLIAFEARPAAAQQSLDIAVELPGVRNFFGAAIGAAPDYLGSDDYTVGIAPTGKFYWDESERYIRLLATELSVNLINSKEWSFGPLANYRFGRKNVDDVVVDRMEDIDGTVELGAFGGWTWIGSGDPRQRLNVSLQAQHDVGGVHDGYLITPSIRYWHPVSRPITVSLGASATYASKNYMSTYFDVTPTDSARSGLRQFSAGSGMRDVRISPIMIYSLSQKWHVAGGFIYSRLLNDAADSPVTDDRGSANQLFGGFGIVYAW